MFVLILTNETKKGVLYNKKGQIWASGCLYAKGGIWLRYFGIMASNPSSTMEKVPGLCKCRNKWCT